MLIVNAHATTYDYDYFRNSFILICKLYCFAPCFIISSRTETYASTLLKFTMAGAWLVSWTPFIIVETRMFVPGCEKEKSPSTSVSMWNLVICTQQTRIHHEQSINATCRTCIVFARTLKNTKLLAADNTYLSRKRRFQASNCWLTSRDLASQFSHATQDLCYRHWYRFACYSVVRLPSFVRDLGLKNTNSFRKSEDIQYFPSCWCK